MSVMLIKGVIHHGQVIVKEPINLPDGSEVTIMASPHSQFGSELDDNRPPTPEEISASLTAMEKMEPFAWTDEERTNWEMERRERKEWEKANFAGHAKKLRRLWH